MQFLDIIHLIHRFVRSKLLKLRLAATAERWGGFGTCVQEWTTGGQRTQLYLTYLALRLSARPDSARRAGATTRLGTGDPEPAKQATTPRAALSSRDPRRGLCLAQGPRAHQGTVISHDSDRSPPGIPGFQSDAAAARRHGSRNREAKCSGMSGYPRGQLPHTDDPARTPPFPGLPDRRPRLIDTGRRLPPFVGCFRLTPRG